MNDDLALMALQAEALYQYDARGRMTGTNEPPPVGPAPRLFLGRTRAGNLWRFGQQVADEIVPALESLLRSEPIAADLSQPPLTLTRLQETLARQAPVTSVWQGPAWRFPARILEPAIEVAAIDTDTAPLRVHFADLIDEVPARRPVRAVIRNGVAVAICFCARRTTRAAAAGVETAAPWRGRGLAPAVVAAWAAAVREEGLTPLYDTSWENLASRRVAAKLGLILYGADCSLT